MWFRAKKLYIQIDMYSSCDSLTELWTDSNIDRQELFLKLYWKI